jgi:hypothetical protein
MLFLKATTGLAYDITIGKKFTFFKYFLIYSLKHLYKLYAGISLFPRLESGILEIKSRNYHFYKWIGGGNILV